MKRMAVFLAAVAVLAQAGSGKTVGVLRAGRDVITPGMLKTLEAAGWAQTNMSLQDLANTNKLAATDVLLFTGGWNDYYFPSPEARRALHAYVAGGKGILSSGFRSGYSRTASGRCSRRSGDAQPRQRLGDDRGRWRQRAGQRSRRRSPRAAGIT